MENNKWKNIAIIEAVVVAVVAIFVIGIFVGKGLSGKNTPTQLVNSSVQSEESSKDYEINNTENNSNNSVNQSTNSSDNSNDNKTNNNEGTSNDGNSGNKNTSSNGYKEFSLKEEIKDLDVTFDLTTTWGDDSKHYYSYTVIFENKGNDEVEDWGIVVKVPDDFEMSSAWNAEWEIKDSNLYLSPVDFNKKIAGKGKVDSVGFIAVSKDEIDFSKAKIGVPEMTETKTDINDNKTNKDIKNDSKEKKAPVKGEYYGKLSVNGTNLVDKDGKIVQLHGVSTHGLSWFSEYVNYDSFKTLRDEYGVNLMRLAMYTHENGGYCTDGNKEELKKLIDKGVDYAKSLDMYVIIDWHVLQDCNPNKYKAEAKEFFEEMSKKYASYDNVIYEICNEPNSGTSWSDVKSYATEIIPVIRKNAKDAIILVGTPTWSQDVDQAAKDPITGETNIMYTLHFYAATHKDDLRNKLVSALDSKLPIFISEFSICDASGNGGIDYDSANAWLKLINEKKLSYVAWSLSNKNETSALIKSSSKKTSGYTEDDFSDTGKWLFETFR